MLFLELIQVALGNKEKLSRNPSDKEWAELFSMSQTQAVVGFLFPAIDKLTSFGQKPPVALLYEWIGMSEQIKLQNKLVNKRCVEIIDYFKINGYNGCILKGQGNARLYSDPLLRYPGDIDIWLDGNRYKIRKFVKSIFPETDDGFVHIRFPFFRDVEVEVHYIPSVAYGIGTQKRFDDFVALIKNEQFENNVELPEGVGSICVPTEVFNVIYQLLHLKKHFFS